MCVCVCVCSYVVCRFKLLFQSLCTCSGQEEVPLLSHAGTLLWKARIGVYSIVWHSMVRPGSEMKHSYACMILCIKLSDQTRSIQRVNVFIMFLKHKFWNISGHLNLKVSFWVTFRFRLVRITMWRESPRTQSKQDVISSVYLVHYHFCCWKDFPVSSVVWG